MNSKLMHNLCINVSAGHFHSNVTLFNFKEVCRIRLLHITYWLLACHRGGLDSVPGLACMRFVVHKVTQGLLFSPVSIIPQVPHTCAFIHHQRYLNNTRLSVHSKPVLMRVCEVVTADCCNKRLSVISARFK
jgi:hypothetical protein